MMPYRANIRREKVRLCLVAALTLIAAAAACSKADPTGSEGDYVASQSVTDEQYVAAMGPLLARVDDVIVDLAQLIDFSATEGVEELLETQYSRVHSTLLLTEAQTIRSEAEQLLPGTRYREARSTFLQMMTTLESALTNIHSFYVATDAETRESAVRNAETGLLEVSQLRQVLGDEHKLAPGTSPQP